MIYLHENALRILISMSFVLIINFQESTKYCIENYKVVIDDMS